MRCESNFAQLTGACWVAYIGKFSLLRSYDAQCNSTHDTLFNDSINDISAKYFSHVADGEDTEQLLFYAFKSIFIGSSVAFDSRIEHYSRCGAGGFVYRFEMGK